MKKPNHNPSENTSESAPDNNYNNRDPNDQRGESKGVQCRECEGFGNIQAECANTLKKNNKSYNTTWSDEDSGEEDSPNNLLAFTTQEATDPQSHQDVTENVSDKFYDNASSSESDVEILLDSVSRAYRHYQKFGF